MEARTIDQQQIAEGIAYAEQNFMGHASHLELDKAFIKGNYDLNGKNVLDFGCGMGSFTFWLAKNFNCNITGIDIDSHHLDIAQMLKRKHGFDSVTFINQNIVTNPLENKYEFIFLNDVAEHIHPDWLVPIFTMLGKHLTPDGVIFVSYPPWESPYASHLNIIFKFPWAQYWPKFILMPLLKKRNRKLVGEKDLMTEFLELNHLNHPRLKKVLDKSGLRIIERKSHTKLNRIPGLKNVNLNFFPFKYLVTKELLALKAA